MAEVRYQKKASGLRGQPISSVGRELKERVELEKLDAGAREDLVTPDARENLGHKACGPIVAIADRLFDELAGTVDQSIVHAPGIDTGRDELEAGRRAVRRSAQARPQAVEQLRDVPSQATIDVTRRVVEAVRLLEADGARRDFTDNDATAAGAQIDGRMQLTASSSASCSIGSKGSIGSMGSRFTASNASNVGT